MSEKTDTACHTKDSTRTRRYMHPMYTPATQSSYRTHMEKTTNKTHKAASGHTQIQTHEIERQRTEDTGSMV